jgi:ATP-binding cassette, subfamily F, member 3
MLTVHQITKSFGLQDVLVEVSFNLKSAERLGLVGPNGSGKTTLLRILVGLDKPEHGSVQFDPAGLCIGCLPQGFEYADEETLGGFFDRTAGDPEMLAKQLEQLAVQLTGNPGKADLQLEYDQVLNRLEAAPENTAHASGVLAGLGLGSYSQDTLVVNLSGGEKTRLALASVLLSNPQLLLLDEPTNHLDLAMLDWLEEWILAFRGAVLVVSHDRAILDHIATGILDLDGRSHKIRYYSGNYSDYLRQKSAELDKLRQDYTDQQDEIANLQSAAQHLRGLAKFRRGGKADSKDKFAKGFFADRSLEVVGRARHLEQRLDRLLTEDKIDKPKADWQMKIEFNSKAEAGRGSVRLEDLSVGYPQKVLLEGLNQKVEYGERLVLIGPNGSGKTTLLRTIAGAIPPLIGHVRIGPAVKIGYMTQEQEGLPINENVLTNFIQQVALSETEARSLLSKYLFKGDDVFIPIKDLSYGERARFSLACLIATGCNFLLLDEPLNHLDISARTSFEQALNNFEGTILVVVHDRYFMDRFATTIWQVEGQGIRAVK